MLIHLETKPLASFSDVLSSRAEPTSALDPDTTLLVEQTLAKRRGMTVWITHDPAQERRVAGQTLDMALFAPNRGINKPDSVVVRVADADDTATDIECVA